MTQNLQRLVVVGHGAAGLAAALAAAEQARSRGLRIEITLLENRVKPKPAEIPAAVLHTCGSMQPDRLHPVLRTICSSRPADWPMQLFPDTRENAVQTIGWLQSHGVEFVTPVYYLSSGPARIQPVGGGSAIVEKLVDAAQRAGVKVLYQTAVTDLVMRRGIASVPWRRNRVMASRRRSGPDAVILASGGFQGNAAMMKDVFRAGSRKPETHFSGHALRHRRWASAWPWTRVQAHQVTGTACISSRSIRAAKTAAPVVLVYPYGIVVDQDGRRFFDEGGGSCTRHGKCSLVIPTSRGRTVSPMRSSTPACFDIEGYQRRDQVGSAAVSSRDARRACGADRIPARHLKETGRYVNAAANGNVARFDATAAMDWRRLAH